MKKIVSAVLLFVCMACFACAESVQEYIDQYLPEGTVLLPEEYGSSYEDEALVYGMSYYLDDDGNAYVYKYQINSHESEDLILPAEVDGHTITAFFCYPMEPPFSSVSTIRTITIPDTVLIFRNSDNANMAMHVEEFIVSEDHPTLEVIDGVLFDKHTRELLMYPIGKAAGFYEVPEGTTALADDSYAAYGSRKVVLPASLSHIGENTIDKYTYVKVSDSETMKRSVTYIVEPGSYAEEYVIANDFKYTYPEETDQ